MICKKCKDQEVHRVILYAEDNSVCSDFYHNSNLCLPCLQQYMKNNYAEQKERYKKKAKPLKEKLCEKCNKPFQTSYNTQKYCQNPCTSKPTEHERWVNKKPRAKSKIQSKQIDYLNIGYSDPVSKRFRACRG